MFIYSVNVHVISLLIPQRLEGDTTVTYPTRKLIKEIIYLNSYVVDYVLQGPQKACTSKRNILRFLQYCDSFTVSRDV